MRDDYEGFIDTKGGIDRDSFVKGTTDCISGETTI